MRQLYIKNCWKPCKGNLEISSWFTSTYSEWCCPYKWMILPIQEKRSTRIVTSWHYTPIKKTVKFGTKTTKYRGLQI